MTQERKSYYTSFRVVTLNADGGGIDRGCVLCVAPVSAFLSPPQGEQRGGYAVSSNPVSKASSKMQPTLYRYSTLPDPTPSATSPTWSIAPSHAVANLSIRCPSTCSAFAKPPALPPPAPRPCLELIPPPMFSPSLAAAAGGGSISSAEIPAERLSVSSREATCGAVGVDVLLVFRVFDVV